jgi:cytochrome oxidase Cu insertion factor (SCO1/SenC/PrrC family)
MTESTRQVLVAVAVVGLFGAGCTRTVDPVPGEVIAITSAEPDSGALEFIDKATWVSDHAEPRGKPSDRFPDVALVDQDGKTHHFYRDLVKDRIVVIQFFYTTCSGI